MAKKTVQVICVFAVDVDTDKLEKSTEMIARLAQEFTGQFISPFLDQGPIRGTHVWVGSQYHVVGQDG